MTSRFPGRPPRLTRVFSEKGAPLYFVTFCTLARRNLLATPQSHERFRTFCETAAARSVAGVGCYVLMPDHVHFFVRMAEDQRLGPWIGALKQWIARGIAKAGERLWQPGFFDHVLRSDESYAEKWRYVRENPVRASLVAEAEEWPYVGEITHIDRA